MRSEDGAGFGYVGVEFVDEVGVLLLDYAAFEFHGEGEAAAVEGEIAGEKGESLDGFVLGEVGGEACYFFFDQGVGGWMRGQFAVRRKFHAIFREFGGDGDGIRNDQGHYEFALIADHHGVKNVGAGFQRVFDRLRSDEFSGGRLEQIFLAVGDEEIVVFVEVADVSGLEPAIFGKNLPRGFGRFEIALHDAGALGEDFTIVGDADLNVADGLAGTASPISRVVTGKDRRGFRQTVALIDRNPDGPKKFAEILGERRSAGKNGAQLAAGTGADFGVNELVGDGPFEANSQAGGFLAAAPSSGFAGGLHGEIEDFSFRACGSASLLHQAGVDFLKETRNGGEDGGMDFEKSLGDVFDDFDVSYRAAVKNINVVEHAAVDMSERQKRDREVFPGAKIEFVAGVGNVGAEIGVGEHDALGLTGGAGGVDKRGELAGKHFGGAEAIGGDFDGPGGGDQCFVAEEVGG